MTWRLSTRIWSFLLTCAIRSLVHEVSGTGRNIITAAIVVATASTTSNKFTHYFTFLKSMPRVWQQSQLFHGFLEGQRIPTRPAQFFFWFSPQTPWWSLGQILPGDQFSANLEVVWPRHGGSEEPRSEGLFALPGDLRRLRDVVKWLPNWLKIGLQAGFGPNFTVEFEAEIPRKNLGWPNTHPTADFTCCTTWNMTNWMKRGRIVNIPVPCLAAVPRAMLLVACKEAETATY